MKNYKGIEIKFKLLKFCEMVGINTGKYEKTLKYLGQIRKICGNSSKLLPDNFKNVPWKILKYFN